MSTEEPGVDAVDSALGRLSELVEAPVSEHVAIYEDIHHTLQETLSSIDTASAASAE